jgi:archaellum component FlaC
VDNELKELLQGLKAEMKQGFAKIDARLDSIEARLSSLEMATQDIKSQLNTIEKRVISLDSTVRMVNKQLSAEMGDLRLDVAFFKRKSGCTIMVSEYSIFSRV